MHLFIVVTFFCVLSFDRGSYKPKNRFNSNCYKNKKYKQKQLYY